MAYPVDHFDTIDSTNTEALRRIRAGVVGPLWIVAREQTAGRGRSGRGWTSVPGNFYGSLILPIDAPREDLGQVSLIAGIAVVETLLAVLNAGTARTPFPVAPRALRHDVGEGTTTSPRRASLNLRLKWPNDILIGTAKLAGILTESTTAADGRLLAVIGVGINLATPPSDLARPVAALGAGIDPAALVAPLGHSLDRLMRLWNAGTGFAAVKDRWMALAGLKGEAITVNSGQVPVAGTYQGLDVDGALLMGIADGTIRRITFGDVYLAGE